MHKFLGGLLLVLIAILLGAQPAAADPTMNWSDPYPVAPNFGPRFSLPADFACPSEELCVGVGGFGNALISTEPTGGAGAWDVVHIDAAANNTQNELVGVSCPSDSFCAAVDRAGNVITSTDPTGGAAAWTARLIDSGHRLRDISCPSASLCVAIDEDGRALASTDPSAGPWQVTTVDPEAQLESVSCPTATFCAAAGDVHFVDVEVFTVEGPAAVTPDWNAAGIEVEGGEPDRLTCPSPSLCLMPGNSKTLVSTSPASGAAWKTMDLGETALACPSASLCVGLRNDGSFAISDDPAVEASWREFASTEGGVYPRSMACAGSSFCVAGLGGGDVTVLAGPEGEAPVWVRAATGGSFAKALNAVSCPSASLCLASGSNGDLYATDEPLSPAYWSRSHLIDGELWAVTCAGPAWCVALGKIESTGELVLLYSEDPAGGAAAWHSVDRPRAGNVSCPSSSFCALVRAGEVLTSTEPLGGASTWTAVKLNVPERITGLGVLPAVSCPSSGFCAVGGEGGYVLVSGEPTGGAGAWTKAFVGYAPDYYHGKGPNVEDVECRSETLCAAVTWGSAISTTTEPFAGTAGWTVNGRPELDRPLAVSCAADASLCVVGTTGGDAVTSFAPTEAGSPWGETAAIDTYDNLADLECDPTGAVCVAVDESGFAIAGAPGARHCKHRRSGHKASKGHGRHSGKRVSSGGKGPRSRCARPR